MREDEQLSGVNWKWFCILAGIVVMVGVATFFLLPSLITKTETDVIIVKGFEEPFKIKPTEPGGQIVDHQNLLIVDILKGSKKEADKPETLRPTGPKPEPPPVKVFEDNKSKTVNAENNDVITIDPVHNGVVVPEMTQQSADKNTKKGSTKSVKIAAKKSKKELSKKNNAVTQPVGKERRLKKELELEIQKRVTVLEGSTPLYMIQLAAFRSAKRAAEMAEILSQKHKTRLTGVDLQTMRVDNGSNGIFHRIVSVPLRRQDADKVCSILRRSGQDCFLRKYETATP